MQTQHLYFALRGVILGKCKISLFDQMNVVVGLAHIRRHPRQDYGAPKICAFILKCQSSEVPIPDPTVNHSLLNAIVKCDK